MSRRTFRQMVEALQASTKPLRGTSKLLVALDEFEMDVADAVCLDVGASAGGFTTALLQRGAARVYAVDAGHGQLLGSLRQDPRVVNLEATNVSEMDRALVPEVVDLVTIDVSYLPLREAVAQLERVELARDARLVGLVKPMFELALSHAPTDPASLSRAIDVAAEAIASIGWDVVRTIESPQRGARGAVEGFVWARRCATGAG